MIQQICGFLGWVKHESQAISPGLVFGSPLCTALNTRCTWGPDHVAWGFGSGLHLVAKAANAVLVKGNLDVDADQLAVHDLDALDEVEDHVPLHVEGQVRELLFER